MNAYAKPSKMKSISSKILRLLLDKKKILISPLSVDCAIFGHYLYIYIYISGHKRPGGTNEQSIKEIEDLPGK